jgi:hypothetical protein
VSVALLGMECMNPDVGAKIEAVIPAGDILAPVILAHVDKHRVIGERGQYGGAIAIGGRLEECLDRLGQI